MAGFYETDVRRAVAAGLHFRPVASTVRETLEWIRTLPSDRVRRAGITREREAEILGRAR
jgi:2'-hydroxyisoflavone reductase